MNKYKKISKKLQTWSFFWIVSVFMFIVSIYSMDGALDKGQEFLGYVAFMSFLLGVISFIGAANNLHLLVKNKKIIGIYSTLIWITTIIIFFLWINFSPKGDISNLWYGLLMFDIILGIASFLILISCASSDANKSITNKKKYEDVDEVKNMSATTKLSSKIIDELDDIIFVPKKKNREIGWNKEIGCGTSLFGILIILIILFLLPNILS